MNIIQLSPEIVAKIAAGEVVERPAYAVKELIENAIDADATDITIDIENSGLKKIAVFDNGKGMTRADLEVSFLPHTTSKIVDMDDLAKVQSFGFRGEALHSIAAISRLVLQSRAQGEAVGNEVVVEGGKMSLIKKIGMPVGTSVFVNDLFFNTPVRKKFLKSPQTEMRLILEIVLNAALSYPDIGFKLRHNGKQVITVPWEQPLEERILSLLGTSIMQGLLPISLSQDDLNLQGYISRPLAIKPGNKSFLFVNKRPIHYQLISNLIRQAYNTLLEPRAMPFFLLFVNLPHQYVDVNIHPRKEQIHLANEQVVTEFIHRAVKSTLEANNLTYRYESPKGGSDLLHDGQAGQYGGTHTYAAQLLRDTIEPWGKESAAVSGDILQLHNLYLVVQTKKGALLIDQHAAHERILYEQFLEEFERQKSKGSIYTLPKAITFDTNVLDAEIIREYLSDLKKFGFDIEEFGLRSFKINAVPALFQDRNIVELLMEVVHDLQTGIGVKNVDIRSHRMLSYLACRTAVKSGDKLTQEQARDLIEKLNETRTQYTCPHGRPVKAEISLRELEKMFRRK